MTSGPAEQPREPARQSLVWAVLSTAAVALWLAVAGGWHWALAGVVGILVHELGHAFAINKAGLGPSRIYMVPFLGGLATQPRRSPDEMTDVVISLAGPAAGIAASLPFFGLHMATADLDWLEGAFFIATINLLNLFPAPPLDGSKALGPVLARIHPLVERGAAVLLGAIAVLWLIERGSFLVAGLIAITLVPLLRGRALRRPSRPLDGRETVQAVGLYVAVAGLCVAALAVVAQGIGHGNPFVLLQDLIG